MFFFPKQGLARIKAFFSELYTGTGTFPKIPEKLCEVKLGKDDRSHSTLAIYMNHHNYLDNQLVGWLFICQHGQRTFTHLRSAKYSHAFARMPPLD